MSRRFHVLGAGAVGLLWSSHLARKGFPVTLLVRPTGQDGPDKSRRRPLSATMIKVNPSYPGGGSVFQQRVDVEEVNAPVPTPISRLLVTTKSYDVKTAIMSVRSRLSPDAVIVLLPNGLGFLEECREAGLVKDDQVVLGTMTHGAIRRAPDEVEHTGLGQTFFGVPAGGGGSATQTATAASMLRAQVLRDLLLADLGCTVEDDIMERLWKKLCVNACINPLTTLLRCRNGSVDDLQHITNVICDEIATVMTAVRGIPCSSAELHGFVHKVALDTARNESSMLQDIKLGRPTEIDYINGYAVRLADDLGIQVPYNRLLTELVRAQERKFG